jgi:hypothetical protein
VVINAKSLVLKIVLHASKSASQVVVILNATKSVEQFVIYAKSNAIAFANILNAQDNASNLVIDNLATLDATLLKNVVTNVLDFAGKNVHQFAKFVNPITKLLKSFSVMRRKRMRDI